MSLETIKILVVEQMDQLGGLFETAFQAMNTKHVFLARTTEHARIIFDMHQHDLLIIDLETQTEGGLLLAASLREQKPDVPIILMSRFADQHAIDQAKSMGLNDLLIKPFSFDDLVHHVHYVLDKAGKSDE